MEVDMPRSGGPWALVKRFAKWEYACLCLIVLATLALHLSVIPRPNEPLFDELHYVKDARVIIDSHTTDRGEHPPLGKLFIVTGMLTLGDNPWGWRMPSVLVGTAGIIFLFLMCRRFGLSRRTSNLAVFLFAFENLTFVHSGIAMLDVFAVSFMILAFWLYARHDYPLAAVAVAMAALSKFNGVFAVAPIFIHWIIFRRDRKIAFVASLLLSGISFMLLLAAFDFVIYHRLVDFIGKLREGLSATASLTFETAKHVSMSRPWEWVVNLEIMPYWFTPHFIGLISFSVWALIMPTVVYLAWRSLKRDHAAFFALAWFAATYLVWIPLDLATNRITFIFYFLPTVGAVTLGMGMWMDRLITFWQSRKIAPDAGPVASAPPAVPAPPPASPVAAPGTGEVSTAATEAVPGTAPDAGPVAAPRRRRRWLKLRWTAVSFVALVLAVHVATFIIVAPPLNNWRIDLWGQAIQKWFQ